MLKKIISGGQTGADLGALDAAIALDISHGGWIPKGRLTEAGPLPARYQLKEMPTTSYPARTEQNVIDSHGTLIISHGKLTGGSLRTKKVADKHKRPCLHIDLNKTNAFMAAGKIINWLHGNGIEILNVAGPRASKDPLIYQDTVKLLRAVFQMGTIHEDMPDPEQGDSEIPRTVEEAVSRLTSVMTFKDKTRLARFGEEDLVLLHPRLGTFIRDQYRLWSGNTALMESCSALAGKDLNEDSASALIIRELWKTLQADYSLRVVSNHAKSDERT